MNRIPKCRSKYYISQPINMNPSLKEQPKENMAQKLSKKTLKFTSSRHFGKDITNNIKSNVNSIYNKHNNKIVTIIEKKQNNNNTIYIKKHSSSSQVAPKNHKNNKSIIEEKKLKENKSGSMINNNNNNNKDISGINNNNNNNNNEITKSKLHSSISFQVNNNNNGYSNNARPISSSTNNNTNSSTTVPIRLSNPKNINSNNSNKINGKINNRSISIHNSTSNLIYGNGINLNSINHNHNHNNNYSIVNNKNHNNIDLVKHIRSTTSRDSMINTINHSYYYNNSKGNRDSKRISEEIKIKKHSSQKRIIKKDFDENKENKNTENIKKENKKKLRKKSMENKDNNESKDIKENKENKESKEKKETKKENKENKDNNTNTKEKEKKTTKKITSENDTYITSESDLKIKYFDTSKINNVQIPKDYLNIIYYNLLVEEKKGILPMPDYTYMTRQSEINEKMRSILIDWLIDVHFKFCFTDETLFMTVSIIDRYLSISQVSRTNFQLLGITALMIACKHEEIDLPKIDDFIYITDNAYKKDEVKKMEFDVLSKLNFAFLYPSPIKFFEYLSNHFNFEKKQHMMGKYLMESFLLDVKNAKYKPSIISCACTYIVMKFFKMKNYQESYSKKFYVLDENKEKYSEHNIKECAKDICLFVDNINKTNYQACVKKYSKPEQENVAMLIMNN